jgi:hypothetical protein
MFGDEMKHAMELVSRNYIILQSIQPKYVWKKLKKFCLWIDYGKGWHVVWMWHIVWMRMPRPWMLWMRGRWCLGLWHAIVAMHALVLYFQALVSNLETIHLFNSGFGRHNRVI